jgi:hypothetical protein
MQVMRLLAVTGVTMAAGAMISLWFAVSPSLTLLPPLPAPVEASLRGAMAIESACLAGFGALPAGSSILAVADREA